MSTESLAHLIAWPGREDEHVVPIFDHLFIGRERIGFDDRHRYLIEDESVSRNHADLRLDAEHDQAWLIDRSTNGTLLNGARMERSVPAQIVHGDRIQVGPVQFQFSSLRFSMPVGPDPRRTIAKVTLSELVMVVGDIISYSTVSECSDGFVLLESIDYLYGELRKLLLFHHGTLSNYVGDAFFATWEATEPGAATSAVAFALDAASRVREIGPSLPLRDPQGESIRMGFAVASGPAATSLMSGALVTVLGDAANVTFRLSGIASRSGWSDVVTDAVHDLTAGQFSYTGVAEVEVKGRTARVRIHGAAPLGQTATLGAGALSDPG
jgi:adenylate cyclase